MGSHRAPDAPHTPLWSASFVAAAGDRQCDFPCPARWDRVASIPKDLPPRTTVYRWFALWRDTGLLERMNHLLVMADRERVGRNASPTAAVLDSHSVKTTE